METAHSDDQCNRDGIAMLGHGLAGLEAQTDDAHRSAVGDLLKAERTTRLARS